MLASNSEPPEVLEHAFDYAIIRVVPRVERGEFLNVGVIVLCAAQAFLQARVELDAQRLRALCSLCEPNGIEAYLQTIPLICGGGRSAGPIGTLGQNARFHWLVAPRSTIIQCSPVHSGLCRDPEAVLERLLQTMVRL